MRAYIRHDTLQSFYRFFEHTVHSDAQLCLFQAQVLAKKK